MTETATPDLVRGSWKLGRLLVMERGTGPGKKVSGDLTSFRAFLKQIELDHDTAMQAQRIGALPIPIWGTRAGRAGEPAGLTRFILGHHFSRTRDISTNLPRDAR